MQHNQPLLSYYPKDNSKFVDPMYVPYQRKLVSMGGDDSTCKHPVNTWKKNGSSSMVHPTHIRKELNMDFLKIHPNDPCPAGWTDKGDGFCSRTHQQAHESSFSTKDHFSVKHQYHDGYSASPKDGISKIKLNNFDLKNSEAFLNRSVNPHTGEYVIYHEPRPHYGSSKYGRVPSRHSYLGK